MKYTIVLSLLFALKTFGNSKSKISCVDSLFVGRTLVEVDRIQNVILIKREPNPIRGVQGFQVSRSIADVSVGRSQVYSFIIFERDLQVGVFNVDLSESSEWGDATLFYRGKNLGMWIRCHEL